MGNPLNGVLTSLFLEFLESSPFKYLATPHILDILLIYLFFLPPNIKTEEITEKLNNV